MDRATNSSAGLRLRYGRLTAVGGAALVTCVAMLTAVGLLPNAVEPANAEPPAAVELESAPVTSSPGRGTSSADAVERAGSGNAGPASSRTAATSKAATALPRDSGTGRRAVFSQSRQRVWLVGADGDVRRTYLVSGSVYDNLGPGTYEVWSRSENAVGIADSGTMKYFVRFTRGPSGAAIGFHDIPVKDGDLLQPVSDLGTARSHGCIRQKRSDARAMWRFAGLGTTVVVTA